MKYRLCDVTNSANTGADAIKRAPIINVNTGLRCLRIGDISQKRNYSEWGFTKTTEDDYKQYKLEKNDIIIARTGNTIGVNCFIEKDMESVYNNGLIRIKADTDKIIPKFMYYIIRSTDCQNYIQSIAFGTSTQPNMKIQEFLNYEFEYYNKDIQSKIVSIIDSIDKKIELNNSINNNLEQQAMALFNNYFPYKIDDLLPNNWRIGTLGEIIELHDSKRIPLSGQDRAQMQNKIYPYYGAASLMDYVDNYIFDGIYLLLGEDGTVVDNNGMPILQYVWGKFWVNNHAHIISGKCSYNVESLYLLFKQTPIKSIITGAVQAKISQANLKALNVVIPPESLLIEFNSKIENLFALIRMNKDENRQLTQLRDTLLPKLMSGEIDVANVKIDEKFDGSSTDKLSFSYIYIIIYEPFIIIIVIIIVGVNYEKTVFYIIILFYFFY